MLQSKRTLFFTILLMFFIATNVQAMKPAKGTAVPVETCKICLGSFIKGKQSLAGFFKCSDGMDHGAKMHIDCRFLKSQDKLARCPVCRAERVDGLFADLEEEAIDDRGFVRDIQNIGCHNVKGAMDEVYLLMAAGRYDEAGPIYASLASAERSAAQQKTRAQGNPRGWLGFPCSVS